MKKSETDSALTAQDPRNARQRHLFNRIRRDALFEFTAAAAHEVNNPLAVLKGHVELLMQQAQRDAEKIDRAALVKSLEAMEADCRRIAQTVAHHRAICAKREAAHEVRFDLRDALADARDFCQHKISELHIDFRFAPGEKGIAILADPLQIAEIFIHLLDNACDAAAQTPDRRVSMDVAARGGFAMIAVTDSGKGIAEAQREHLFLPFFSTKNANDNFGIGLKIAKRILSHYHGAIELDPESPNTCWVVTLPTAE